MFSGAKEVHIRNERSTASFALHWIKDAADFVLAKTKKEKTGTLNFQPEVSFIDFATRHSSFKNVRALCSSKRDIAVTASIFTGP